MNYQLFFIAFYVFYVVILELLVEKRLKVLNERHHQKMGGGYASLGLFKLHRRLILIIRIISVTILIIGIFISISLL